MVISTLVIQAKARQTTAIVGELNQACSAGAIMDLLSIFRSRVAVVFPGQGSQYVGMGRRLAEVSPTARQLFARADAALGIALTQLMFEGNAADLDDTINAQPAILTVSVACFEVLRERMQQLGQELQPRLTAGHSLGEYTALVVAGAIGFEEAVRLVRERGRIMKESAEQRPGGMAAVDHVLEEVVREAQREGLVTLANANSPGQTVLSGEIAALKRAMDLAQERGARMVQRLAISIASHSPMMEHAQQRFGELIQRTQLRPPQIPLIANISAQAITSVEDLRQELIEHLTRPVQWTHSVRAMLGQGIDTIVEIGPRQVLTGLNKRISSEARPIPLNDIEVAKIVAEAL
jgi:[acyl-carrier-protein] S-malonyltransferase